MIEVGQVLASRYRADALLGRGGMGEVWRCFDLEEERSVALKTVLAKHLAEPWVRRLLHAEVVAVARLGHPGIVEIYDLLQQDDGTSFLVMGYRRGKPLHEALPNPPSWEMVRTVVVQMLEALAHAHARTVLHLDMKPANVLVDPANDYKTTIVDFGIARIKRPGRGAESWLDRNAVFGTLEYMAPEQYRGELVKFGPWTDLYSIGLIAYELCSGELPHESPDPRDAARVRCHNPAPVLVPRGLAVPAGFRDLVARLLALAPSHRPACAADVLAELERIDPEVVRAPRIEAALPPPSSRAVRRTALTVGAIEPSEAPMSRGARARAETADAPIAAGARGAVTLDARPIDTRELDARSARSEAPTLESPALPPRRADVPTLDGSLPVPVAAAATMPVMLDAHRDKVFANAVTLHAASVQASAAIADEETGPGSSGVRVVGPSSRRLRASATEDAFAAESSPPTPGAYGLFGLRELPVLGRVEERKKLWSAVGATGVDGRPGAVELVGPAGTGKSRLARDAAERALELGLATVLTTHWSSGGSPDEGLRGLVENALESRGSIGREFVDRLDFWLERAGGADEGFAREVGVFLRPEHDAAPDAGLPVRVTADLVTRAAAQRPVLLWLDDVQWSRGEATALVKALAERTPRPPVCVLATVRDDELGDGKEHEALVAALRSLASPAPAPHGASRAKPSGTAAPSGADGADGADAGAILDIPMRPLDVAATKSLVRGLLDLENDIAEIVARRAEGNPLFVRELVGQLVGERALERKGGRYGLSREIDLESALPNDIGAVWERRVALSGAGVADLQLLALVRERVAREVVDELLRLRGDALGRSIDLAMAAGLLRDEGGLTTFSHGLLRSWLVRSIPESDRPGLAATSASALAPLVGREDVQAERAHHLRTAGERDAARDALLDASMWSWRRVEHDRRGERLKTLLDWSKTDGAAHLEARAHAELASLHAERGERDTATAESEAAIAIADGLAEGTESSVAWVLLRRSQVLRLQGKAADARRPAERALETAKRGGEHEVETIAIGQLAQDARRRGDKTEAGQLLGLALSASQKARSRSLEAQTIAMRADLLEPAETEAALSRAIEMARACGATRVELMARHMHCEALWHLGKREMARREASKVSLDAWRLRLRQVASLSELEAAGWAAHMRDWPASRDHRERAVSFGAAEGALPERALLAALDLVLALASPPTDFEPAMERTLQFGKEYAETGFLALLALAGELGGSRIAEPLERITRPVRDH